MRLTGGQLAGASDEVLINATRSGDERAYAELWRRHRESALVAARSVTRLEDPEDLVSEAFTRILQAIREGRGPSLSFRPYLLVTVKNIAVSRSRSRRDTPLDDADDIASPILTESTLVEQFEHSAVATAYQTLPRRWQQVLWYSEVENMAVDDIAVILGVSAKNVPTLAYRAREGLRQAWIQAHISATVPEGEHRWVLDQLGRYTRGGVTEARRRRIDQHLSECRDCAAKATEARTVGSTFALALLGLFLGTGAAAYAAWTGAGTGIANASTVVGTATHLAGATASGAATHGTTAASHSIAAHSGATGIVRRATSWAKQSPGAATTAAVAAAAAVCLGVVVVSAAVLSGTTTANPQAAGSNPPAASAVAPPASTTPTAAPTASSTPTAAPTETASAPPSADSNTDTVPAVTIGTVDVGSGGLFPIVSGTADAGATIELSSGKTTLPCVTADGNGEWRTSELTTFSAGTHVITATATAKGGTTSTASQTFSLTAPAVTLRFAATGSTSVTAHVSGTASTTYELTTTSEKVVRTVSTDTAGSATASWGSSFWSAVRSTTLTAQAVAGKRTGPRAIVSLPTLTPAVTTVDTGKGYLLPVLSGLAAEGTTVTVLDGSNVIASVTADKTDHWTTPQLDGFTAGSNTATVRFTKKGESTQKTVKTFELSASVPTLTYTGTGSTWSAQATLTGGKPGATYALVIDGTRYGVGAADTDGAISTTIDTMPVSPGTLASHTLAVALVDGARSGPLTDVNLVVTPTLNVDTGGGAYYPAASGYGTPGSTVTVSGGENTAVVTVDANGTWSTTQLSGVDAPTSGTITAQFSGPGATVPATTKTAPFSVQASFTYDYISGTATFSRKITNAVPHVRYKIRGNSICTAFPNNTNTDVQQADADGHFTSVFNFCQNGHTPKIQAEAAYGRRFGPVVTLF